MKTLHRSFRLAVLPATLMAAFGCALAEEPDVDELTKPDSSVSVGVGSWSADRRQQGIYDGMREGKAYGLLDADIVKRDEETGTWLKLKATDLGLDTRELRGDYIRQGDFGGFLEYNRTTRENPLTYNTRLQGIGSDNLTLGTGLGSFPRRDVELGTTREMTRLGGFKTLVPGLELKIDFKNEEKTGTRQTGWGSAALFSVEPVDSTTRQLEAILQYTGTKLQLSGGYYGSWYDNHETMVLQRFNGVSGGTSASLNSVTPLSLPLGNQAHQAFFEGGYAFTPTTRGTFKLAYTRATQDETLPSYGLGGANAPFINAPSSLNGRVDTTLVQLGLSSRPLPKLSITGSLRYYDVDDKTPLRGFVGSNATGVATVFNTPQSYTHHLRQARGDLPAAAELQPDGRRGVLGPGPLPADRGHGVRAVPQPRPGKHLQGPGQAFAGRQPERLAGLPAQRPRRLGVLGSRECRGKPDQSDAHRRPPARQVARGVRLGTRREPVAAVPRRRGRRPLPRATAGSTACATAAPGSTPSTAPTSFPTTGRSPPGIPTT